MASSHSDIKNTVDCVLGYFDSDTVPIEEKRDTLSKIIHVYKSFVSSDTSKYEDITI